MAVAIRRDIQQPRSCPIERFVRIRNGLGPSPRMCVCQFETNSKTPHPHASSLEAVVIRLIDDQVKKSWCASRDGEPIRAQVGRSDPATHSGGCCSIDGPSWKVPLLL